MECKRTTVCRVCLAEDSEMRSVFNVENYQEESTQISEVIMTCASVQIYKGDGLPELVCTRCIQESHRIVVFRRLCENSDATLRDRLFSTETSKESKSNKVQYPPNYRFEDDVKAEIKIEYEEHPVEWVEDGCYADDNDGTYKDDYNTEYNNYDQMSQSNSHEKPESSENEPPHQSQTCNRCGISCYNLSEHQCDPAHEFGQTSTYEYESRSKNEQSNSTSESFDGRITVKCEPFSQDVNTPETSLANESRLEFYKMLSERGKELVVCENYKFSRHRVLKSSGEHSWRCVNKGCNAALYFVGEVIARKSGEHSHSAVSVNILSRQQISNSLKRKARENLFERPSKLLNMEINLQQEAAAMLTKKDAAYIRNNISHMKQKSRKLLEGDNQQFYYETKMFAEFNYNPT